jgi:hypothetical protein
MRLPPGLVGVGFLGLVLVFPVITATLKSKGCKVILTLVRSGNLIRIGISLDENQTNAGSAP